MLASNLYELSSIVSWAVLTLCGAVLGADIPTTECFTCIQSLSVGQCMETETCQWGEICYTTVERGGLGGNKYTKGCKEANHCYALESLNTWRTCDQDPSNCVYCCAGTLCNVAMVPSGYYYNALASIVTLMLSWVSYW